jgi:hypothetical protein
LAAARVPSAGEAFGANGSAVPAENLALTFSGPPIQRSGDGKRHALAVSDLSWRYESRIAAKNEQLESMLRILLATCETALDAFRAADNPIDTEFVAELERITERTRQELAALAGVSNRPS